MSSRIQGLDALRFLCALCVVQGHLRVGGYFLDQLDRHHLVVLAIRKAFSQGIPLPTGPNAVIVFFVISGFCIHYPYKDTARLAVGQFLGRRYMRIGIPALVAAYLLYHSGFKQLQDSVLWSIICESIYYTLYPLLLGIRRRIGWGALLGASFAVAYLVIALHMGGEYDGDFPSLGTGLTWLLGLPCWLLGCLLAETYPRFKRRGPGAQWRLRAGIVLAAASATVLRFFAGVGYYWTQPALSILIYAWLGTEIAYFMSNRPWRWLEHCGRWSYSVYLFHAPIAIHTAALVGHRVDTATRLLLQCGAVLVGCYLMYLLVERPAHLLARRYIVPRQPRPAQRPA